MGASLYKHLIYGGDKAIEITALPHAVDDFNDHIKVNVDFYVDVRRHFTSIMRQPRILLIDDVAYYKCRNVGQWIFILSYKAMRYIAWLFTKEYR